MLPSPFMNHLKLIHEVPFCSYEESKVIDSRLVADSSQIRRRRECNKCNERWTTFELAELLMPKIVKQDKSRVPLMKLNLKRDFAFFRKETSK